MDIKREIELLALLEKAIIEAQTPSFNASKLMMILELAEPDAPDVIAWRREHRRMFREVWRDRVRTFMITHGLTEIEMAKLHQLLAAKLAGHARGKLGLSPSEVETFFKRLLKMAAPVMRQASLILNEERIEADRERAKVGGVC